MIQTKTTDEVTIKLLTNCLSTMPRYKLIDKKEIEKIVRSDLEVFSVTEFIRKYIEPNYEPFEFDEEEYKTPKKIEIKETRPKKKEKIEIRSKSKTVKGGKRLLPDWYWEKKNAKKIM